MTIPRTLIGLLASVALHIALVAVFAGVAVFEGWKVARTVDFELVNIEQTKVDDLPFGPPPPPPGAAEKTRTGKAKARPAKSTAGGVAVAVRDAGADAGAPGDAGDGGAPETGADAPPDSRVGPDGVDGGIRRRDEKLAGPAGSRLTALLRLDRLRATPDAAGTMAAVDGLLRHLPDRRRLLDGTGLDLFRDFDVLYVATPNPLDDAVTFLVVRHHLDERTIMAAFAKGAERAGRPLTWSTEGGRPVGIRAEASLAPAEAPATPGGVAMPRRIDRDDRIFVLPEKGLAVMAPPAYAPLLLGPRGRTRADAGAGVRPAELRFRDVVRRIDAEDGATPENAILVMSGTNILSGKTAQRALPESAGGVQLKGPGGLAMPGFVNLVVGVQPQPFLELTASYEQASEAQGWAAAWPGWKQSLLGSPLLLFSGFSPLVARATLVQDDNAVVLRTDGTQEELRRVLGMIANLTGAATRR